MNLERIPEKLLGSWMLYIRRIGNAGRPQQIMRHAYVHTHLKMIMIQEL